jgi:hypothetical protein
MSRSAFRGDHVAVLAALSPCGEREQRPVAQLLRLPGIRPELLADLAEPFVEHLGCAGELELLGQVVIHVVPFCSAAGGLPADVLMAGAAMVAVACPAFVCFSAWRSTRQSPAAVQSQPRQRALMASWITAGASCW